MASRPHSSALGGSHHRLGTLGVDGVELAHLLGVDDAGGVHHIGIGTDAVEQACQHGAVGDVTHRYSESFVIAQQGGLSRVTHQSAHLPTIVGREQTMHERPAEPACGSGDHGGGGGCPTLSHGRLRGRR